MWLSTINTVLCRETEWCSTTLGLFSLAFIVSSTVRSRFLGNLFFYLYIYFWSLVSHGLTLCSTLSFCLWVPWCTVNIPYGATQESMIVSADPDLDQIDWDCFLLFPSSSPPLDPSLRERNCSPESDLLNSLFCKNCCSFVSSYSVKPWSLWIGPWFYPLDKPTGRPILV